MSRSVAAVAAVWVRGIAVRLDEAVVVAASRADWPGREALSLASTNYEEVSYLLRQEDFEKTYHRMVRRARILGCPCR